MHRNAIHDLWLDLAVRRQLLLTIGNQYGRPDSKFCSISGRMVYGTRNRHSCVEIPLLQRAYQYRRHAEHVEHLGIKFTYGAMRSKSRAVGCR
jgi:hypothetical protein